MNIFGDDPGMGPRKPDKGQSVNNSLEMAVLFMSILVALLLVPYIVRYTEPYTTPLFVDLYGAEVGHWLNLAAQACLYPLTFFLSRAFGIYCVALLMASGAMRMIPLAG